MGREHLGMSWRSMGSLQDLMFLTIEAFFRGRSAAAYRLKRIPLLSSPDVFSEQFACRRRAPVSGIDEDAIGRDAFQFDSLGTLAL